LQAFGRVPLTSDRPVVSLYLHTTTEAQKNADIHAPRGIRTPDTSVRPAE